MLPMLQAWNERKQQREKAIALRTKARDLWFESTKLEARAKKLRAIHLSLIKNKKTKRAEYERRQAQVRLYVTQADVMLARARLLYSEGEALWVESHEIMQQAEYDWLNTVARSYGDIKISWPSPTKCVLENGDIYE